MNREEARKMALLAPVLAAFGEGKSVQYKSGNTWWDQVHPSFDPELEWRVKPEPKKVYIVRRADGTLACVRHTKETADKAIFGYNRSFPTWGPYYVESYTQDIESRGGFSD
jgi:hypothetical protein